MYVPSGRVGWIDLSKGCYTGYEVFRLAAQDLAQRGLASNVAAMLQARHQTVRQFLADRYGVMMGER